MKYLKLTKEKNKLREENISYWFKNEHLKKENAELRETIKELCEQVKYLNKKIILNNTNICGSDLAKAIASISSEGQEHKCTPECFKKHVIKAIQNDYNSIDSKNNKLDKFIFINYWNEKLSEEYTWLKYLYIIDDKIYFESK